MEAARNFSKKFLTRYWYHLLALAVILVWALPYFTTGNRIELGDFGFFAQAYEGIRVSILNYHQFPWWNPWMNGGIPLYANPQVGVFSIQTILVLIFGVVWGLKLALVAYIIAGYFSMYILLRRYFKVRPYLSVPLSLAWIFSSFFASHLPPHFTFAWFMLAPLFIYFALTLRTVKQGLIMGLWVAIMALSEVHYALFYTCEIMAVILAVRFIIGKDLAGRKQFLLGLTAGAGVVIVLAGQRLILASINGISFNRVVESDKPVSLVTGLKAILLPFRRTLLTSDHSPYPTITTAPFGWGEATASIGVTLSVLTLIVVTYWVTKRRKLGRTQLITFGVVILSGCLAFLIGLGVHHGALSPYWYMKHLPVLKNLRISTRWFIFTDLAMLLLIGLGVSAVKQRRVRLVFIVLVYLGTSELFVSNFWYQRSIFTHIPNVASKPITYYPFDQTDAFGETRDFPDGKVVPPDGMPAALYREYEATTYNIGVIRGNEALVNNLYSPVVRCAVEKGCGYVLTNNAKLTSWSPDKVVLRRTAPGPIVLDINATSYEVINGKRQSISKTAEVLTNLTITNPANRIELDFKAKI